MWVIRCISDKYEVGHYYQVGAAGQFSWIWLLKFDTVADAMRCTNYLNGGEGIPVDLKIKS
jgi:hypothetical protein